MVEPSPGHIRFRKMREHTVATKIIADPEKCFQELISEESLIFIAGWALSGSNYRFQQLFGLQDKLLESVRKLLISVKRFKNYWARPSQNKFSKNFGADSSSANRIGSGSAGPKHVDMFPEKRALFFLKIRSCIASSDLKNKACSAEVVPCITRSTCSFCHLDFIKEVPRFGCKISANLGKISAKISKIQPTVD